MTDELHELHLSNFWDPQGESTSHQLEQMCICLKNFISWACCIEQRNRDDHEKNSSYNSMGCSQEHQGITRLYGTDGTLLQLYQGL